MKVRRPEDPNRLRMCRRDVTHVRDEAVARVESVETPHHPVPDDLRHDRGSGDSGASRVSVDERPVRRRGRTEAEPVDETRVRRRMEIGEDRSKRRQVRAMKPRTVDLGGGDHANADPRRAADDRVEERFAFLVTYLLRVVQPRERPNSRLAQRLVVEEDTCDDEWSRE